ncbi:MAG: SDR family NAD(P)-dependent oxidoreductase, partial [Acidimicrobiia bacterium]|nr:SDR family NAD(P)-dependent oxidoreductase [Acidimicrobiia bacterium]
MEIEGSVFLITGGASGLGLGAAERMIARGGKAVLLDLNEEAGRRAVEDLGKAVRFIACDVSDPDQVRGAVSGAKESFGRLDVLVNAAGVAP